MVWRMGAAWWLAPGETCPQTSTTCSVPLLSQGVLPWQEQPAGRMVVRECWERLWGRCAGQLVWWWSAARPFACWSGLHTLVLVLAVLPSDDRRLCAWKSDVAGRPRPICLPMRGGASIAWAEHLWSRQLFLQFALYFARHIVIFSFHNKWY